MRNAKDASGVAPGAQEGAHSAARSESGASANSSWKSGFCRRKTFSAGYRKKIEFIQPIA